MPLFGRDKTTMVSPEDALPGRDQAMPVTDRHVVLGTPMEGPWPDGFEVLWGDIHPGAVRGGVTSEAGFRDVLAYRARTRGAQAAPGF